MRRFYQTFRTLMDPALRHRVRLTRFGALALAILDATGVGLILPLVQLITSLDAGDDVAFPASELTRITGTTDAGTAAVWTAVAVFVLFIVKGVAAVLLLRFSIKTCLDAERDMASRLFRSYLDAPFSFHLARNSAELQTSLHESLRHVYQEGLASSIPAFADRVVMVAISAALVTIAPLEAVVGGASLAVIALLYRRVARGRTATSSADLLTQVRRSYQLTQQALSSIREIIVTGTQDEFVGQIDRVRDAQARRQAVLSLTEQLPRYYLEVGLILGTATVAAMAFLNRDPEDALAVLGVFIAGGLRLLPSLNRVMHASAKADAALPHLNRVLDDLEATRPNERRQHDTTPLSDGVPVRSIHLRNVGFSYAEAPVLRKVNLGFEQGTVTAIVGTSGSGKTTLVSLLLGLLDPSAGDILIDDTPISDCRQSWQRRIGYVPQDVVVIDDTIRRNVAFGDDQPDDERAWRALELARLADVVSAMPAGLDSPVGEAGSQISGGQRQRLGLARCFYREPDVFILDEATSSLDTDTEARVLDTLDAIRDRTTVLVVTHRLTTVERFDRIAVLADGVVEALGTHAEVRATSETFRILELAQRPTEIA